jgi:succinate dehydrogenase / fumarate reductase cytochrome b subunit
MSVNRSERYFMSDLNRANRPLSPHLTIYRPQFTSVLSILHRITGIALIATVILIVIWFVGVALGPYYFNLVDTLFDLSLVRAILVCSIWATWYHTCTGIRHLIWDAGFCLEEEWINPSAYIVLVLPCLFTLGTLYIAWAA